MPLEEITGKARIPRTVKARLGYKKVGEAFPRDTDVFVARAEDGWSQEALQAYNYARIKDADPSEGITYSVGSELRLMLWGEYNALDVDGHEISLELLNRNWGSARGIKCSGTGGQRRDGIALCRDQAMATAISRDTGRRAEPNGRAFDVTCRGPRCKYWHTNHRKGGDPNVACHAEMRLHARLLHPTTDRDDPNYMRQLGWVEVVSGSYHGMVDVQSGFQAIGAITGTPEQPGRTAFIPFTLKRERRTMYPEGLGGKVIKSTLMVDSDVDEVLRYGTGPRARAMLRPALRRELLELAAAEMQLDSARDILPQPDRLQLSAGTPAIEPAPEPVTGGEDPDESSVQEADAEPAPPADDHRSLTPSELDYLKRLCGAEPGKPETMGPFKAWLAAAYDEFSTWSPPRPGMTPPFDMATLAHAKWIAEKVRAGEAPPAAPPEQPQQGDLLEGGAA